MTNQTHFILFFHFYKINVIHYLTFLHFDGIFLPMCFYHTPITTTKFNNIRVYDFSKVLCRNCVFTDDRNKFRQILNG